MADVAWWGWVVRHHHPDAWGAAWPTFRAAAGVPPGDLADAEIRAVMLVRLLGIGRDDRRDGAAIKPGSVGSTRPPTWA